MEVTWANLGFSPADILLPHDCDLTKWSVVACDQYTAQPDYWERVANRVGEAPSTLKLILPESKLTGEGVQSHRNHQRNHEKLCEGKYLYRVCNCTDLCGAQAP
ncbi:MAG: DUF1015 family protein [Oscillospiraceae bacterium]